MGHRSVQSPSKRPRQSQRFIASAQQTAAAATSAPSKTACDPGLPGRRSAPPQPCRTVTIDSATALQDQAARGMLGDLGRLGHALVRLPRCRANAAREMHCGAQHCIHTPTSHNYPPSFRICKARIAERAPVRYRQRTPATLRLEPVLFHSTPHRLPVHTARARCSAPAAPAARWARNVRAVSRPARPPGAGSIASRHPATPTRANAAASRNARTAPRAASSRTPAWRQASRCRR